MNKIFIFAVVAVASISIYPMEEASELDKMDIVLANVEALSDDEANTGRPNICYKMLDGLQGAPMEDKTWCTDCKPRPALQWKNPSTCF